MLPDAGARNAVAHSARSENSMQFTDFDSFTQKPQKAGGVITVAPSSVDNGTSASPSPWKADHKAVLQAGAAMPRTCTCAN